MQIYLFKENVSTANNYDSTSVWLILLSISNLLLVIISGALVAIGRLWDPHT